MWLAASSFEVPDGLLATRAEAQLNPKPHQGLSSENPAPHPALDDANSTVALGLRAGLALNGLRQSERARYYGSALGRFISPDPESASASLFDPQRWNAYSYAVNNPYKFVDPDGENPLLISGGVGLVVGAVGGALFDVGNQLIQNGGHFDQINRREILGATIGGAVSGGLAGLTLGLITPPATLTASYLAISAVVNGGSNVVGGIVQREIDPTASNTRTTDFVAGAVGGAVGTKVAYVRYPLLNVKKELEAISFSNRRSMRSGKVASLNTRAASQSTKNIVTSSVFGTSVANFLSTLWLDLTHKSSSKACVEAHDSHGNGTGQTCSN